MPVAQMLMGEKTTFYRQSNVVSTRIIDNYNISIIDCNSQFEQNINI